MMLTRSSLISAESTFSKVFALLAIMVGCFMALAQDTSPNDWQLIDVEGLFTFRLPDGFAKRELAVNQTPVGEYRQGSTRLEFRWRPAMTVAFEKRRQEWMNDYEESTSRIRGKRANIRTYWRITNGAREYHAEVNVGNWERGEIELYMAVESPDQSALQLASKIFKSITFPIPIPERPE